MSGIVSAATATAAMAAMALLQKKRASLYRVSTIKLSGPRRSSAARAAANGAALMPTPSHGLLQAEDDPAEGYEMFPIDFSMHVQIRQSIVHAFLQTHPEATTTASVLLLHGGVEVDRYDTDIQYNFHQESFFQYVFGVREPGCAGLVDLTSRQSVLCPSFE